MGQAALNQVEGQLSAYGTWAYRGRALRGGLSEGSYPVFTRVSEKTTALNEERCALEMQGTVRLSKDVAIVNDQPVDYYRYLPTS